MRSTGARGFIERHFNVVLLGVYALLTLSGMLHHEPWRDEAEIWLTARDLPLRDMLRHYAHFGGTPTIWPLLNYGLVHAGFPYASEFVLHWIIALAALIVFVTQSPFSRTTKVLFAFSYLMAYEYALVARHYGIGVLFLFATLAVYGSRHTRPFVFAGCVFLVFQTNTHTLMAPIVLSAIYLGELRSRKRGKVEVAAAALMLGGFALLVVQVLPSMHSAIRGYTAVSSSLTGDIKTTFRALGDALLAEVELPRRIQLLIAASAVGGYVLALYALSRVKVALAFGAVTTLWLFYMFSRVYYGGPRHHGLVLVFLLAAFWLGSYYTADGKIPDREIRGLRIGASILNLALAVQLLIGMRYYVDDYRLAFSGSRDAAAFLNRIGVRQYTVVAYTPWTACAILPYIAGFKFWYPDRQEFGSYLKVDEQYFKSNYNFTRGALVVKISNDDVVRLADQQFPAPKKVLLLLSRPLPPSLEREYQLVYNTQVPVFYATDEVYYIYMRRPPTSGAEIGPLNQVKKAGAL